MIPTNVGKRVTSKDPRKKLIMDKLKQEARCQRVTLVSDHGGGVFSGSCLRRIPLIHWEFEHVGRYWVKFELDSQGNLGQHIDGGPYESTSAL